MCAIHTQVLHIEKTSKHEVLYSTGADTDLLKMLIPNQITSIKVTKLLGSPVHPVQKRHPAISPYPMAKSIKNLQLWMKLGTLAASTLNFGFLASKWPKKKAGDDMKSVDWQRTRKDRLAKLAVLGFGLCFPVFSIAIFSFSCHAPAGKEHFENS